MQPFQSTLKYSVLAICFAVLMAGCAFNQITLSVKSGKHINLAENHSPLSVVIRVYQLKGGDSFEKASLTDLLEAEEEILGRSLVTRDEFTVFPNQDRKFSIHRKKGAHFLGVLALFRNPDEKNVKLIQKMESTWVLNKEIFISIHRNEIHLEEQK